MNRQNKLERTSYLGAGFGPGQTFPDRTGKRFYSRNAVGVITRHREMEQSVEDLGVTTEEHDEYIEPNIAPDVKGEVTSDYVGADPEVEAGESVAEAHDGVTVSIEQVEA